MPLLSSRWFFQAAWASFALACYGGAQAQESASHIARVTVYPGSATVERVAKVAAGARSITLACLPASLDVQSLQVQADSGIRIGELRVQTDERDAASACASPLDGRIRALQDRIAALKAETGGLQLVDAYLKSVASGATGEAGAPARAPAQIGATAEVLRKSGQEAQARTHQLQRQQEDIERELKPLLAERERVASQRARVVAVGIHLAAERDGELRLSYQVRGPGWQPLYRAVLDSARASVQIERLALVAQASGEDWSGVQLTLSTGQPQQAVQGRLPRPWTLDVAPPPQPARPAPIPAMAAAPAPAPMAAREHASADQAMPSFEVGTLDKGFATEFAVPQRISVPTSGQRVTLSLGVHQASAQLLVQTAPGVEEAAYLMAEILPPPGVWPAGSVSLYRDGAYVGAGRLDFAAATLAAPPASPGALAPTRLAFGRDELVRVRAEAAQETTGSAGLTGARTERQVRRAYQIENRHKTAVDLLVLHAAPVPRNEKIEVQSRYEPAPAETAWNRQNGTVAWRQSLGAGASARFAAEHVISHPKDIAVLER